MRFVFASLIAALAIMTATLFGPAPAAAQGAEWCAVPDGDGDPDCSYYTFQECQTAISGVGGQCQQNLRPSTEEPGPTPILPLPHLFGGDHPARDYGVPPPPGMDPAPPYPETPAESGAAPAPEEYAPAPPGYPPPPR
jgi:hypothetical protein